MKYNLIFQGWALELFWSARIYLPLQYTAKAGALTGGPKGILEAGLAAERHLNHTSPELGLRDLTLVAIIDVIRIIIIIIVVVYQCIQNPSQHHN